MHMKPDLFSCLGVLAVTVFAYHAAAAEKGTPPQLPYQTWQSENFAIDKPLGA